MTKAEFYDSINTMSELVEFCETHDCYHIVEDLRESGDFDSWVWEQMEDLGRRWYWTELRDTLEMLEPPTYDYFLPGENLTFSEPDLDEYKNDVIEYLEEYDYWDEEDDEWIDIDEDDPLEDENGDACWDVSVDLSVLIGVG